VGVYAYVVGRRGERLRGEIGSFMKAYGRSARRRNGHDPNDRNYSRRLEAKIKRMPPAELDRLLRDDLDDEDTAQKAD